MAIVDNGLDRLKEHVTIIESKLVSWVSLANGDSGSPVEYHTSADRSVQVVGTFGAGGTVVIEGSNDGTNYVTLTDPQANALSFSSAGLEAISELTRYIRPRVTGGDGTTSLSVYLIMRKS